MYHELKQFSIVATFLVSNSSVRKSVNMPVCQSFPLDMFLGKEPICIKGYAHEIFYLYFPP